MKKRKQKQNKTKQIGKKKKKTWGGSGGITRPPSQTMSNSLAAAFKSPPGERLFDPQAILE